MSAIYYQRENILPPKTRYIFHPVGLDGKYNEALFDSYPFAREKYEEMCDVSESQPIYPGTIQIIKCRDVVILNAYVFINGYLSFDALNGSLEDVDYTVYGKTISFCKHYFPPRDWQAVEGLIETRIETMNPIVFY